MLQYNIYKTFSNFEQVDLYKTKKKKKKTQKKTNTKTYLYNFDPLKLHFYIVKLGFTEVYIILHISAQTHRLWIHVRTASARRF